MDLPAGINKIPLFVLVVWTGSALGQSSTYCNNNYGLGFTASSYYNHSITSPNYPLDYDLDTDCLWEIEIDMWQNPGYIVKVIFNDFDLGLGQRTSDPNSCRFDYLKFYGDSSRSSDSLLGIYCSTIYPDVIYSTGQYLYVEFHSDVVISSRGFNFSFSAVKKEEAAAICRSPYLDSDVLSLRGSSGTFFSPDYPVPYPNAATCIWTITVPAGKRVKLTFESFGLDTSVSDCSYKWSRHENDYIEIRDALSSDGKEIGYYCDFNTRGVPPDVYSTGRYMWVKFHASADGFLQFKNDIGFKAHFDAVDPPSSNSRCLLGNVHNNDLRLTGSSGTLKTPQGYYPPGLNCNWLITVPKGKTVELTFSRFQLDPSRVCGDYVEVLDGQHVYSKRLGKFCGYDSFPEAIQSTSRYMRVTFESDLTEYTGYEGFEATFKALNKSSGSAIVIGISVSLVVLCLFVVCIVCIAKWRQSANSGARGARMPMETTTTSAPHTTQPPTPRQVPPDPAENTYPPLLVGYAPEPTIPPVPPPAYPYPPDSPPPYPEVEGVPQYPPPGQSYPWLQKNAPIQPSAPPASP